MREKGVSVIIPCYNSEKTIFKCIKSVLGNDYCCEIIVVDDGSTDKSAKIIKALVEENKLIKYYYKKNGGVSSARNYGLEKATGEYVLFVDSDDYIEKKSIDTSYEFTKKNNLDICNFLMEEVNFLRANEEKDKKIEKNEIYRFDNISDAFFKTSVYSSCAKIFRRKIIMDNKIRFLENLTYSEDYIFVLNICKHIKSIGFCKKAIYYVENVNPNSISKSYVKNMDESINEKRKITKEIFKIFPEYEMKYFKYHMGREHFWFISYCDNLFKKNSPYNFVASLKIIDKKYKELKKDKEYKDKSIKIKPKRKIDKLYYFLIHCNSSLLIGIALKIKNILIQNSLKKKGKDK